MYTTRINSSLFAFVIMKEIPHARGTIILESRSPLFSHGKLTVRMAALCGWRYDCNCDYSVRRKCSCTVQLRVWLHCVSGSVTAGSPAVLCGQKYDWNCGYSVQLEVWLHCAAEIMATLCGWKCGYTVRLKLWLRCAARSMAVLCGWKSGCMHYAAGYI